MSSGRAHSRPLKVKICGITSAGDALTAVHAGADAIGLIFHPGSPRAVTVKQAREIVDALPPFIVAVGVFVNAGERQVRDTLADAGLDAAQLHGDEPPELVTKLGRRAYKALQIRSRSELDRLDLYPGPVLLDGWSGTARGGTGTRIPASLAKAARSRLARQKRHLILAGGLAPDNIVEAVEAVEPWAIDVNSGVEASPGKKDPRKIAELFRILRAERLI